MSENFCTIEEIAEKWKVSERSVRTYCEKGRVEGAKLSAGSWQIPVGAVKPSRLNISKETPETLLSILKREDRYRLSGGIYHKVQVELTYNSNHIEGSRLSHDQTRYIFETNTVGELKKFEGVNTDDVVETSNHFRCIDYIIENANRLPNKHMMKKLHFILKNGTSDSRQDWFAVGSWKKFPNEVGGKMTTLPGNVEKEIDDLLKWYKSRKVLELEDLLAFHEKFESIHPFQDGNGRVGRLILFKECLRLGIVPFIIDEEHKMFYYRGLSEWKNERGYLIETCRSAQDKFKKYLDYYGIKY